MQETGEAECEHDGVVSDERASEPLYQPLDTHWTNRGLQIAAELLAARIKRYPWASELAPVAYSTKSVEFAREGDFGTVATDGFRVGAVLLDHDGRRVASLPAERDGRWHADAFPGWSWPEWTVPRFHWRLKPAYESLRQLWSQP